MKKMITRVAMVCASLALISIIRGQKKRKASATMITVIAVALLFAACHRNPKIVTVEQVSERILAYFKDTHDLDVTVINVSYDRVGQRDYLNIVAVSDGETEYRLILDRNNKPMLDDVSAARAIKDVDASSYEDRLKSLGLLLRESYTLGIVASYGVEFRYYSSFSVKTEGRPSIEAKDGVYSLLEAMKNEGIELFVINVTTPSFLLPKHRTNGIIIDAIGFDTDIDITSFEELYNSFVERVYWDKQKFDEKIIKLTQLGYRNAYFFIPGWYQGNTLEIVLYCESDDDLSDEPAIALLEEMDDSYIKIADTKIQYTLQLIYR